MRSGLLAPPTGDSRSNKPQAKQGKRSRFRHDADMGTEHDVLIHVGIEVIVRPQPFGVVADTRDGAALDLSPDIVAAVVAPFGSADPVVKVAAIRVGGRADRDIPCGRCQFVKKSDKSS